MSSYSRETESGKDLQSQADSGGSPDGGKVQRKLPARALLPSGLIIHQSQAPRSTTQPPVELPASAPREGGRSGGNLDSSRPNSAPGSEWAGKESRKGSFIGSWFPSKPLPSAGILISWMRKWRLSHCPAATGQRCPWPQISDQSASQGC